MLSKSPCEFGGCERSSVFIVRRNSLTTRSCSEHLASLIPLHAQVERLQPVPIRRWQ